MDACGCTWSLDKNAFTLQQALDAGLFRQRELIEDIADAADQQSALEAKLAELKHKWAVMEYDFVRTPRGTPILTGALLLFTILLLQGRLEVVDVLFACRSCGCGGAA